jgi:cell division protein FtsI (penicillin-binding protein 3)
VKTINGRIGLLFAAFLVLLSLAAVRAIYFAAIKGPSLRRAATDQQASDVKVPAPRGTISDRNGVDLAVSEPAFDVAADPLLIKAPLDVARQLAGPMRQSVERVMEKLSRRDSGFVYLARDLPSARATAIQRLKIDGLEFIPAGHRAYPRGSLASQVLGTVGTDGEGLAGLEYSEDRVLRGRDGHRHLVKDALGQAISLTEDRQSRAGTDLQLTLDAGIQDKVEHVLAGVGRTFTPRGATALVLDPNSGQLLAMANWPPADAADLGSAPEYARQNRAVSAAYEPGSTFKAFTVAGALQDGLVGTGTTFDLAPEIQVADRTIHEGHDRGYERLTTGDILAQSSNVGAVTIGLREGSTRFDQWVRQFGFGASTGSVLPGEQTGIVPRLDQYSGSSMGNLPIGQGLAVTPLQMAAAYAAIANGGILRKPQLVLRKGGKPVKPDRGRRVISPATSDSLRQMLEGVLEPGGTASAVSIPGYQLAGKTGTANKPDPVTGGYSDTKFVASFIGFAPARRPKLLVAVMVDEPHGSYSGAAVAAPAFQQIAAFALPYLGIAPS